MAEGVGRAGARVVIWARRPERNDAAMAETLERHGEVDSRIANAGIAADGAFVDASLDDWHRVLRTNLDGTFLCTRAAARHFVDLGRAAPWSWCPPPSSTRKS